jgi:hypothetical protein
VLLQRLKRKYKPGGLCKKQTLHTTTANVAIINYQCQTHLRLTFDTCSFFMFKTRSLLPHHSNMDNLRIGIGISFCIDQSIHNPSARRPCYLKIVWTPKQISFKTVLTVVHTIYRYVNHSHTIYRCVERSHTIYHCVDRFHTICHRLTDLKQFSRTFFRVHLKVT